MVVELLAKGIIVLCMAAMLFGGCCMVVTFLLSLSPGYLMITLACFCGACFGIKLLQEKGVL